LFESISILAHREDDQAWFVKIRSPQIDSLISQAGKRADGIELAFPKTLEFIRRLQWPEVNRLVKFGWTLRKTLFIDTPYLLTFNPFLPSQAASYTIDVQEKAIYFRVVAFQQGYVASASRIELEDTVLHETDHLKEHDEKGLTGQLPLDTGTGSREDVARRYQEHDDIEQQATFDILATKYGKDAVTHYHEEAKRDALVEMTKRPMLFPVILEFWLGRYCSIHADELKDIAITLPEPMSGGEWATSWADDREKVLVTYRHFANVEPVL